MLEPMEGSKCGTRMEVDSACRLNQQNSMLAMLRDGIGSDVTLLSKDNQLINAHKCILSNKSSVFKTKFSTQMIEKEIELVEMVDMGSEALNIFLKFCYTGEIEENWGDFYEDVISAADKYDVPLLLNLCDEKLFTLCTKENCLDLVKVANQYKLGKAKERIKQFIVRNIDEFVDKLLEI
ncbi:BTB/POZ domain-containing protein At1g21780 [Folsomia candida]|nr:BTB/POZ domain-containing protein At1g21780 [Folsomia candida]